MSTPSNLHEQQQQIPDNLSPLDQINALLSICHQQRSDFESLFKFTSERESPTSKQLPI